MSDKGVILFVLASCLTACCSRDISRNTHKAGVRHLVEKLHKEHPAYHKNQKHVVIPGGGTTVIQGANYGGPVSAAAAATYPGGTGQCCPPSQTSCCAQSQPPPPPCCLTLQPYGSKSLPVNAPSKVILHINVLPGTTTAAPTTAATSAASTVTTSSTSGKTAGTSPTISSTATTGSTTPTGSSTGTGTATPTPTPTMTEPVRDRPIKGARYRLQALAEANRLRSLHSRGKPRGKPESRLHFQDIAKRGKVRLLRLDEALNNVAQRYANQLAASKKPAHSDPRSRRGQGENIAVECSHKDKPLDGKVATDMWYNEVKLYKWNHPGYNPKTAHFTQLVWQGTKRVGFGRANYVNEKGQRCYVLVARYAPRGNVKGYFPQNVMKGMYQGQQPSITKG